MPGQKTKTSKLLLILSLLACPGIGLLITQSSHLPASIHPSEISVPLWKGFGSSSKKETKTEGQDLSNILDPGSAVISSPAQTSAPVVLDPVENDPQTSQAGQEAQGSSVEQKVSGPYLKFHPASAGTISPEASAGTWTKTNNEWFFIVNSQPFHGWLYDKDKRIYYLDPASGVMLCGWQNIDGKQYYFNGDGVLQSGRILIDGASYEFDDTGVLLSTPPATTVIPASE